MNLVILPQFIMQLFTVFVSENPFPLGIPSHLTLLDN